MGDGVDSNPGVILRGVTERMKRKLHFIAALVLTAVVTGGIYAYTYNSTSVVFGVSIATGDMATIEEAVSQPDWSEVIATEVDWEILRPEAAGDETNIASQFPASGSHWAKVDEETPDDASTYVYNSATSYQRDLYNVADHSTGTGTISNITVYVRVYWAGGNNPNQNWARIAVKSGSTVDEYEITDMPTRQTWYDRAYEWATNPDTDNAWTWDEIDSLQIGIALREAYIGGPANAYCTQVYVEVEYEYLPITGDVPAGDLFEVTPHTDYPGDLSVKVYLTNTDNLTKAYEYLNMELYLEGSVEAGETPNYQLLTLDNGIAAFTLIGGGGIGQTLSVIGGDYGLVSDNISGWEEGWSVTPELYCEATQR